MHINPKIRKTYLYYAYTYYIVTPLLLQQGGLQQRPLGFLCYLGPGQGPDPLAVTTHISNTTQIHSHNDISTH